MKTSLFSLFLIGAALLAVPPQTVMADDDGTTGQASSSGSTNSGDTGAQGQRLERLKAAFAQLGLTDAQKEQIKQIRATVTDRKERRQEIIAILTPDQKAKLRELIMEHKDGTQTGSDTPLAPEDN